ncbi:MULTISPECIES: hypothetical protein [Streptomyces]|nr:MULTISPECIES: hypothetical protein [Streptomyces]
MASCIGHCGGWGKGWGGDGRAGCGYVDTWQGEQLGDDEQWSRDLA